MLTWWLLMAPATVTVFCNCWFAYAFFLALQGVVIFRATFLLWIFSSGIAHAKFGWAKGLLSFICMILELHCSQTFICTEWSLRLCIYSPSPLDFILWICSGHMMAGQGVVFNQFDIGATWFADIYSYWVEKESETLYFCNPSPLEFILWNCPGHMLAVQGVVVFICMILELHYSQTFTCT